MNTDKLEKVINTDLKIIKRYIIEKIFSPGIFALARFCDYLDYDIIDYKIK